MKINFKFLESTNVSFLSKILMLSFVFLSFCFSNVFSQITITKPWLGAVYQRDVNNKSHISIEGNLTASFDSLEANFYVLNVGQGTTTGWQTIASFYRI